MTASRAEERATLAEIRERDSLDQYWRHGRLDAAQVDRHALLAILDRQTAEVDRLRRVNRRLRKIEKGVRALLGKFSLHGSVPCDDLDEVLNDA